MLIAKRLSFLVVVAVVLAGSVSSFAREDNIAQGQLLRVDADARKIVIQTAQGSQLQCTFNGDTRVTGSTDSVKRLPAKSRLTVHYAKEDAQYLATEIEVHTDAF